MKKTMKKSTALFLTLLMILSIVPTNVTPIASATDERIQWTFDGETLVVSGTGELSEEYTSTDEWVNMQKTCMSVIVEGDIEVIGDNAFEGFTAIINVEVTSLLQKIGKYAFAECTSMENITLPDSVSVIDEFAFSGCKALKSFYFPQNLIRINQWAFKGCECFDNKALVLPDTLQKVGYGAFSGANITSLTSPFVGVGVIKNEDSTNSDSIGHMFGNISFSNSYVCRDGISTGYYYLPNSLKEVIVTRYIYDNNFENAKKIERIVLNDTLETTYIPSKFANKCQGLKTVVIESLDRITKIGSSAFECCYALEDFVIPPSVTEIGYRAFALCRFSNIEIPQNVEVIGEQAFFNCSGITSIEFPDSIKSIGEYAFKGCSNLEIVKFPNTYYTIGEGAFDETKYTGTEYDFVITEDGALTGYRGTDTEIVVPEGVTQIGTVFAENTTITSIVLPNSLLCIEENAFSGCSSLTEIILPDGLLTIPKNAFNGCSSLTGLTIPDTVLTIESDAFNGCCSIKELVIPDSVVEIQYRAFACMCSLEKLTVPFVGKTRDVKSNTDAADLSYWFDVDIDFRSTGCAGKYHTIHVPGIKKYIYMPESFNSLTVTGGVLRSYALELIGLEFLTVGENVEAIEEYAAYNIGLIELNLHEDMKITEIPDNAFNKNSITSVTIPKNVKKIGAAFGGNQLSEINLNDGLEVIGPHAFAGAKITSIDLPDSLLKIGYYSFECCVSLERIEFPESLTEISGAAFNRAGLKEIVFSENITYIGGSAFNRCPVQKIVIPESLSDIAEEIFKECEELEMVVIGGNVEEIGAQAFADCPTLETVVIPDSVTSISDDAFENASENLVIYCNEGSYAQTYATENNIKYTTLVIDPIENQTYTGEEITPEINASANNRKLTQDTEYSVSYKDNINAGSAKAIVKGLGDFKHLATTARFTILPQNAENVSVISDCVTYNPNGVKPELYVFVGGQSLVEGQDYEIADNMLLTDAGAHNIAVSLIGNYAGVVNVLCNVEKRPISQTNITYGDVVNVTCEGVTLEEGKDYIVKKEADANGNTVITVEGIGNYEGIHTYRPNTSNKTPTNWFKKLMDAIMKLFENLFNMFF